jgi:hexokinase
LLETHHMEHFKKHKDSHSEVEFFDLGFTFSFPVNQASINKGELIR